MIFFDGSCPSLDGIAAVLDEFRTLSGMGLNKEKTALFHAGMDDTETANLNASGFLMGSLPIRYLGLPSIIGGLESLNTLLLWIT